MNENTIIATLVQEEDRLHQTCKAFGTHFPMTIEPVIYFFASQLSRDYCGGYWHFYELGKGFYMAPDKPVDERFQVISENGWSGAMSADAFGICCCLFAFSHLSFSSDENLAELCAWHFYLLREFMLKHLEVMSILAATD